MICPLDALYPREREILALVAEALAKLQVPNRAGAVAIWYQHRTG